MGGQDITHSGLCLLCVLGRTLEQTKACATDGEEGVLQLQGEGGEGDLLRHREDSHGGQVGRLVPGVPLTPRGVESQAAA